MTSAFNREYTIEQLLYGIPTLSDEEFRITQEDKDILFSLLTPEEKKAFRHRRQEIEQLTDFSDEFPPRPLANSRYGYSSSIGTDAKELFKKTTDEQNLKNTWNTIIYGYGADTLGSGATAARRKD